MNVNREQNKSALSNNNWTEVKKMKNGFVLNPVDFMEHVRYKFCPNPTFSKREIVSKQ
jgi:hypothetical protein